MSSAQEDFVNIFRVSYETTDRLSVYEKMLIEWNLKFNLISASTLPFIWQRHFVDSAQLMEYIPPDSKTVADMGSGAGFPGLVLAILAKSSGRNLHVDAIESTGKKADFLQTVVDELELDVGIKRTRVEDMKEYKADVVTARALKALPDLLVYANYLTHKDSICIFPKGRAVAEELTQAKKYWTFDCDQYPSRSDDSGSILVLSSLRYKSRR